MDYRSVHVVYIHAESGTRRYPNRRDRNERKKGRKRGTRCDSTEAARRPGFMPRDQLGFAKTRGIAT